MRLHEPISANSSPGESLFNRFLGLEIARLDEGFARVAIPFRDHLVGDPERPALHGGVLSAAIDAAGGAAAFTLIELPDDRLSTIDLRVDYLRPAGLQRLVCEARVSRMGNRIASVDVIAFHGEERDAPVATGKAVYSVRRGRR